MSNLDVQIFREDGTWIKPARALTVDVVIAGGDASSRRSLSAFEIEFDAGKGSLRSAGGAGEVTARTFGADELPEEVAIEVGRVGRASDSTASYVGPGYGAAFPVTVCYGPGGGGGGGGSGWHPPRDGLAVIIAHLAD